MTTLVRPETFGAVVYDTHSLNYFFINQEQFGVLKNQNASVESSGSEPDYSQGKFTQFLTSNTGEIRIVGSDKNLPIDSLVAPIRVYFEITTQCDGGCKYCLNNSGSCRPGALTEQEIIETIDNLARDGVFETRITGGEPTMHPGFYNICKQVKGSGMNFSLNSHLKISNQRLDQIVELSPSLLITSLDAHKTPHEENRGKGYDEIVGNILRLREAGVDVRLNCLMSTQTIPYIEDFMAQFAPIGCGFCFIVLRPTGRAQENFNPPDLETIGRTLALIKQKEIEYPNNYVSTSFHVVMKNKVEIAGIDLTGCNAIQKSFNINSDGSVLPCAFLYELNHEKFNLGNVRDYDYSAKKIWCESENLRNLRRLSRERNEQCITCNRFNRDCYGSCVFMKIYSEITGKPDRYCRTSCEGG